MSLDGIKAVVQQIAIERYPDAHSVILAGSYVRGDATSTSDLDVVVLCEQLPAAFRESFMFNEWPVEVFVHDMETLEYFFCQMDAPSGFPALITMVDEGIVVVGEGALSNAAKLLADKVLKAGPSQWTEDELNNSRYAITNLIDDLKDPQSDIELRAIGCELYQTLANYYFRQQNLWSAKGKTIVRVMRNLDPTFAERFIASFNKLFVEAEAQEVIKLAEDLLAKSGGPLFAGHMARAPESWRIK